ncbi:MAG: D-alanine--D-alanine ligase [bacterium]
MKIAIAYNKRPDGIDRNDPTLEKFIEGDEWKTIEAVGKALSESGHLVSYFPISSGIYEQLKQSKNDIDLLLNLSEGINPSADREAQIPMVAEILGIPHTGPGPLSSALILNKSRAKEIWKANGVRTAHWQLFQNENDHLDEKLLYPLIVKPNGEGSGIGIKSNSIVSSAQELKQVVSMIIHEYHQNALVEEYLPGREFTIGLIGNGDDITILPIIEINFDAFPSGTPRIDSYEAKFIYGATGLSEMTETEFCPARVTKSLEKELNKLALAAYQTIGCLDFGRVDLRLDNRGRVNVMEINHPPGLMSDPNESSFFTIASRAMGWDFTETINKIVESARVRLNL